MSKKTKVIVGILGGILLLLLVVLFKIDFISYWIGVAAAYAGICLAEGLE